jgi:hypothetical protein
MTARTAALAHCLYISFVYISHFKKQEVFFERCNMGSTVRVGLRVSLVVPVVNLTCTIMPCKSYIFVDAIPIIRNRSSSVSIVSGYGLNDRAIEVQSPVETKRIFPLASVSRSALGPTQPPVQWVPGVLSPGVKRVRGVMLTTHPHLVPRS